MKKKETLVSLAVMCALSAANIAFVESGIWKVGEGKAVDISGMDAASYGVTSLNQTKEGYRVHASAAGFQSDVEVAVTFDSEGKVIQALEIASQAETDGIGSNVTSPEFTGQFAGVQAPVSFKGKDLAVVSPGTGAAYGAVTEGASEEEEAVQEGTGLSDPAAWNPQDQSVESNTVRKLYASGLTLSAMEETELVTPVADLPAEEQSLVRMERAGLLASSAKEEAQGETGAEGTSAGITTELDAVSGATISSSAAAVAVNNAYFFLQEEVLAE
ncbi:MAG: FMN-binding protein [Eubacteriales bacterium]|nr:FMN-binding protein [Eubacteriales bacterium]